MGVPWSRVVNATTANYIKGREVNILRNRKLTALLKEKNRITFNWSGTHMDWKVKYKRVKMSPFADGDTLDFARKDRTKTAKLDWRGYSSTDSMYKGEYLQNKGAEAIVNLYADITKELVDDMEDAFGEEFYVNGNLPQNSKGMHGIESFMQALQNPGNGAGTPVGKFAGLDCTPGTYGGNWQAGDLPGWPNGRGDAHYDFWSPIIVDYGDTLFGTSPNNKWKNTCVEAIGFGIIKSKKSRSQTGQLDVIMLDDEMYRGYVEQLRSKERIVVSDTRSPLIKLGFSDVVNQDGTDITFEYGMPPGVGYGFNCDMMELRSQQGQIFVPEGPDWDIAAKAWRYSVDFYGNLVWNPKFQVKFVKLTA